MRHIYTKIFRSEFACLHGEAVGGFWDFSGFEIRKNPLFPPWPYISVSFTEKNTFVYDPRIRSPFCSVYGRVQVLTEPSTFDLGTKPF